MIILHLSAYHMGLVAWAETDRFDEAAARQGRHPFALNADELRGHLMGLGIPMRENFGPAGRRTMLISLPSTAGQPVPSAPLGSVPQPAEAEALGVWEIDALLPRDEEYTALMAAVTAEEPPAEHLQAGRDAQYWGHAMRFAANLARLQRFVPTVEEDSRAAYARWRPMMTPGDRRHFDQLAALMPPSARAVIDANDPGRRLTGPRDALRAIVEITLDQIVRQGAQQSQDPGDITDQPPGIGGELIGALTRRNDRRMKGLGAQLARIRQRINEWRYPLDGADTAPVRLCLQLSPPEQDARGPWTIRHMLQARHNPGLLASGDDVWQARHLDGIREPGFNLRVFMERESRRLLTICPDLEGRWLSNGQPADREIDNEAAHAIITHHAAHLKENGFSVLVAADWAGPDQGISIVGKARPARDDGSTGMAGLSAIMEFDWNIALGDQEISARDLDALADAQTPLIRLQNRWMDATSPQARDAVRRWLNRPPGGATAREVLAAYINPDDDQGVAIDPGEWLGAIAEQMESRQPISPREVPAGLTGELRPYQERGYGWLEWLTGWGLGACLADDMGLGKTITSLAVMLADQEEGIDRPCLIACPTSLLGNWRREAERFAPSLGTYTHHGTTRANSARRLQERAGDARLIISSYGTVQRDEQMLAQIPWRTLVLDEAQNIKNPESKRAKAIREIGAERRIALTGTPVENHAGDLWAIMQFLNPGLLGSRDRFRRRFTLPLRNTEDTDTAEKLHRITAPFMLRRMKSDPEIAPDLPEKFENKVHCTITREQASLYAAILRDLEERLERTTGIERLGLIFRTTTRLKQVCNHPAQLPGAERATITGRSGKLTRLVEMAEVTRSAEQKSIVFTQYVQMGRILQDELSRTTGEEVPFLHGAVRPHERDRMVEQFQNDSATGLIIVSVRAGGHGLNLTAATNVFHYDRWWNPAVENQASDRAFRIGQTKNVQIHKLICLGTLEEKIDRIIESKTELADRLVGSGDDWLGQMSNHDLRDVLSLTEEAA